MWRKTKNNAFPIFFKSFPLNTSTALHIEGFALYLKVSFILYILYSGKFLQILFQVLAWFAYQFGYEACYLTEKVLLRSFMIILDPNVGQICLHFIVIFISCIGCRRRRVSDVLIFQHFFTFGLHRDTIILQGVCIQGEGV